MANYKSQYTGEQIDEGIGKALSILPNQPNPTTNLTSLKINNTVYSIPQNSGGTSGGGTKLYLHTLTPSIVDNNIPILYFVNNNPINMGEIILAEGEQLNLLFIVGLFMVVSDRSSFPGIEGLPELTIPLGMYMKGQEEDAVSHNLVAISFSFGDPTNWKFWSPNVFVDPPEFSPYFEYSEYTSNPLYYTETVTPI